MKSCRVGVLIVLTVAVALAAVTLEASDWVGVYAIVEKVVLEPSESQPQRIQIWGVFALSDGRSRTSPGGPGYEAARRGYLYYTCPRDQERICRNEWADLTSVAGTGQGIGFGGRYLATGRIRARDERPAAPDPYPIELGLVKVGPVRGPVANAVMDELRAALQDRSPRRQ